MPKSAPIKLEQEYIKLDKQLAIITAKHRVKKLKLLGYHEKGYTFSLIRMSDTTAGVFCPPWKEIAFQLAVKLFKTEKRVKKWFESLAKQYPRTERSPSISYPGKKKGLSDEA